MASPPQPLKPAILIISDTAAKDPSTDRAAPVLKGVFFEDGGKWQEPEVKIVGDDVETIRDAIKAWTDRDGEGEGEEVVNLVLTTGGTGFAKRDWTPEAVGPLLERHAPGLVHAMLAASLQVTPFAMMSRPVAGVRKGTIIFTVPGSPKGAKENLEAVLKLLPHACMQAAGMDSRALHAGGVKKLEKEAGVSKGETPAAGAAATDHSHNHHHHHHHDHGHGHGGHQVPKPHTKPSERPQSNDPNAGPSQRYRESPYPMLSVDEAVEQIITQIPAPTPTTLPYTSPLLVNSTVSSPIHAKEAVPAYRASIVDGYAVIVDPSNPSATKGIFPVASISHAQSTSMPPPLEPGTITRITTGAPLPPNANAVVMVEDTVLVSSQPATLPTGQAILEEKEVEILTSDVKANENIREPGSDIALDSLILSPGTLITPVGGEIGLLAASGNPLVPVYSKPSVGVLSTGDEVTTLPIPSSSPTSSSSVPPLHSSQIRDSNRPSLLSLISSWNLTSATIDLGISPDTPPGTLESTLRSASRLHSLDIIVTTGGVSMGELDLLKPTIERSLGGTVHFGRVAMKPGKPTTFASFPFKESETGKYSTKFVFGLPGNPASALVTASLFLLPALQKWSGQHHHPSPSSSPSSSPVSPFGLPRLHAILTHRIPSDPHRTEYHRVIVRPSSSSSSPSPKDDKKKTTILTATSTGPQRSSRIGSLVAANGLLVVEAGRDLERGEGGMVLLMGALV